MKRILIYVTMLLGLTAIAVANAQVKCYQGDQRPAHRDPHEVPGDSTDFAGLVSVDPNEIIGPQGYDSLQWVSVNDVLNYTIYFENDPEFATANAQRVDVRFDFPQKNLMKDFILGGYGFANMSWEMEKASNTYQDRINLADTMNIYVDLIAGLDVTRKQAFWKFSSIDPESGFAPWQSDRGMLPVNDSTHVGEGFVRFSIKPVSTMNTGDTISIQANIVFDQNDTIPTNRWKNVIDAGNPVSRVAATADSSDPQTYHLRFEAADDEKGSGVKQVYLYMADQFGVFQEYAACAPDSVLTLKTEPGKRYEFYTLAEDNVGNREPLKEKADLVLNNNMAPTDIILSSTTFRDDIISGEFIAEISTIDTDENGTFTYALAEGEGAIHNDMFQITGAHLQAKDCFKCADESVYNIRISTTDEGGLSFSKAFVLNLEKVLTKPEETVLDVSICEGDVFDFKGEEYDKTGTYRCSKSNENMCDSVFVLNLTVLPIPEKPTVKVEGICTLVSSVDKGNQWFFNDGTPVEGATGQKFTPEEDGVYYVAVSNGSCFSERSEAFQVQMTDRIEMQLYLAKGWNWVSSNLSDAKYKTTEGFLSPVVNDVYMIEGANGDLVKGDNGFSGALITLEPQESYRLMMNQGASGQWKGVAYRPEETPISLQSGWNRLGYLPVSEKPLQDAFSNLTPSEGDVIKTLDDFAVYNGGRWRGTLKSMRPGEGYMYYTTADKTLVYPVDRVSAIENVVNARRAARVSSAPWSYDPHAYRDNTTMIAELYRDDVKTIEGAYTVGAFVNDECRGIGTYVDGLLYLTIHGSLSANEMVSFKAYETATANELPITETVRIDGMHSGSVSAPYQLHVTATSGIEGVNAASFNIYPNPVRSTLFIGGDPDGIDGVKILSTDGKVMISTDNYSDDGIDVSSLRGGVYVVAIHTPSGYYYEKFIKANM